MTIDISKLKEEYDEEGDFKVYVDKYMRKHGITDELAACKCIMVQRYWLYLHGLLRDETPEFPTV